jgi:hypothetical protein
MPCWFECVATTLNLAANAVLARRLCEDAAAPVPRAVLVLQATANLCWATHATRHADAALATTAIASFCLQATSLLLTARAPTSRAGEGVARAPSPWDDDGVEEA